MRQFKPGQLQSGSLYPITASNAVTASYAISSSQSITASFSHTASYVTPLHQNVIITGSIYIPDNAHSIYFSGSNAASRLVWNDIDGTLDLGLKGGNVTLQLGQELVQRVVNKTGADLLESQYRVVRIRRVDEGGAQGQRLAIVLAQANNDANSVDTLGIVTENITDNQEGFITTSGLVRGINTTGTLQGETWTDGDVLYLSPFTPGVLTKIKPSAPSHTVIMGYVVYAHNNQGKIFVKVDNGYEIDELHNVLINTASLAAGQLLVRSGSNATGVWINSNQLSGSYSLTGSLNASAITGSFTGSFRGDGSQLTGIVSSKWSGSNPISRESDVTITGSLRTRNTQGSGINTALGQLLYGDTASVDWRLNYLKDQNNITSIDWQLRRANDFFGTPSINWDSRGAWDSNDILSIDWETRQLVKSDESIVLDWENGLFTGSLYGTASNAVSASYAVTASYLDNYIPPFPYTGSAEITGSLIVTGSVLVQGSITGSLFGTASLAETANIVATNLNNSYNLVFSQNATGPSILRADSNASIIYNPSTNILTLGANASSPAGQLLVTGSIVSTQGITGSLFGTSSYATRAKSVDSLNQDVYISGSLTVVGQSTFYGSASFVSVTASNLFVSESFISVNVFEPVERFGGLKVYDSGSSAATASLAWDSLHNHWVYENVSGSTYTGGMLLSGPRNTGSLGDEPTLAKWFVPRGDGGDHLENSQIYSSGSVTQVTGSLTVTNGVTASLQGTASFATSASFAVTASHLTGYVSPFPYTGSALITGSLGVTGSLSTRAQGALSTDLVFRVRNSADTKNIIEVRGDGETRWNGLPAVGNYVAIKNYTSYDATIDLMTADGVKAQIFNDNTSNTNLHRGLNIWNPGIVGQATAKINNIIKSGLSAYGQAYGFNWAITSNASGTYTQAERAMFLTHQNALVLYSSSASPTDTFGEKSGSFEIFASSSISTNGVVPHFKTERGNIIWLGSESRLFNVTASRTTLSASNATSNGPTLTVYGSGSTQPVFTVQGSQGELFSVTDSLSGSLFSVNDISGLPILEVFSDNTTLIGNYLDPMLITTAKVTQTNSGSFTVYSLPTASYDTAFFEYSVKSGSNARAGTIMAIQSGTSVNFTETTTTDFGSTSAISLGVFVTGSFMALTGSSTSGAWTIKSIVRGL